MFSSKKILGIEPPVLLNQFYKKSIIIFLQAKHFRNSATIFPQETKNTTWYPNKEKTTYRRQPQDSHLPPELWRNTSQYMCGIMLTT